MSSIDQLGLSVLECKEVSDLSSEFGLIIKLLDPLWALQMEPKNRVEDASVCEYPVFHGFLKKTVHVVFFQFVALFWTLTWGLVKVIHFLFY